ncbi:hypothetical protein Vafri_5746 [Volvox africanus]|nr:hypothetical protein Vafri_5746 [Volvox africanus]
MVKICYTGRSEYLTLATSFGTVKALNSALVIMKTSLAPVALVSTVFALLLFALEACAKRQLRTASSGEQIANGTLLSLAASFPDGRDYDEFYLRQDDGQMYRLSFCSGVVSAADLTPNARFAITYSSIQDGVMYSCQKPRQLDGEPPAAAGAGRRSLFGNVITTPTRPTFLIYIVSMCGYGKPAATTPAMLKDVFFGGGKNVSLAGYYNTCSYGQAILEPSRVVILANLTIPCNGNLKVTSPFGYSFDSKNCSTPNLVKWHYYLDSVVLKKKIVPTDFNHKIIILPPGFTSTKSKCFSSAASVGPWFPPVNNTNSYGTGLIWWSSEVVGNLNGMFHEVGHTLGMAHAGTVANCGNTDQCDHTCPMGAISGGQGTRCLNAPHLWQLGWGQPFWQLTDTNLPIGTKQVLTIPPQMTTSKSFVMVYLNTMPGSTKLYVAVRINTQPYDLPYVKSQNGQPFVVVHSYNGTADAFYQPTILLADVPLGENFVHSSSGLVINFVDWDSRKGASARFCQRAAATEQNCYDGIDDDCDNLPDEQDPDCSIVYAFAKETNPQIPTTTQPNSP